MGCLKARAGKGLTLAQTAESSWSTWKTPTLWMVVRDAIIKVSFIGKEQS